MKILERLAWLSWFCFSCAALNSRETDSQKAEELTSRIGRAHQNIGPETPAPRRQQILRLSIADDSYQNLNPYCTKSSTEDCCLGQIFEGLLIRDAQGQFQGACAQSWNYDVETYTWTFKIRPGLKWNNGEPLTAHDFVRGIRANFDTKTYPHQTLPASVETALLKYWNLKGARGVLQGQAGLEKLGVSAPDAQTLKLEWSEPCIPELCYCQFEAPTCIPLHPSYLQQAQTAQQAKDYTKLVTNGPFRLVNLVPGSGMALKKNPHFWDAEHIRLEEVHYLQFQDNMESIRAWEKGAVDISLALDSQGAQALAPGDYDYLSSYVSGSVIRIEFNLKYPHVRDKRVRQAINLILDRDELGKFFILPPRAKLHGYLELGHNNGFACAQPEWSEWNLECRIEKAQKLLRACGYHPKNKLKLNLAMPRGEDDLLLKGVIGLFKTLKDYVELEAQAYEPRVFGAKRKESEFEVNVAGVFTPSFHPFLKYQFCYHGETGNLLQFKNEGYDRAIKAFKAARTHEEAERALLRLERILWDEAPVIPLFACATYYLVSNKVGGWEAVHRSPVSPSGEVVCRYLFKKK